MCINISGVRTAWKMVPTAPAKTIEKIEKTKKKTGTCGAHWLLGQRIITPVTYRAHNKITVTQELIAGKLK